MKLLYTILGAGLFLLLGVLLAFPSGAAALKKHHMAQDKKAQNEKPKKLGNPDKAAESSLLRVKLNVTVFDSSNRPVTDVSSEDFQVFEDGVQQTIVSVNRQDGPLSYGLLVDCSGSLRSQNSTVIRAGRAIVANMKPDDEAFLMRFISHDNITVMQDWTSTRAKLHRQLAEMYLEGGQSAIVDAVYVAAQHIAERRKLETSPHRHSLVLITDGEDRISYYNLEQLLKLVRDSDLQIFVIGLAEAIEGMKKQEKAIAFLNTLANETGGRVFMVDGKLEALQLVTSPNSVDRALLSDRTLELQQIAAEIVIERDAQYLISYDSTHDARDGSFRKVRVAIREKEGRDKRIALTRPGYTVPTK